MGGVGAGVGSSGNSWLARLQPWQPLLTGQVEPKATVWDEAIPPTPVVTMVTDAMNPVNLTLSRSCLDAPPEFQQKLLQQSL